MRGREKGRDGGRKRREGRERIHGVQIFLNLYPHIIYLILGSTIAAKVNQRELCAHRTCLEMIVESFNVSVMGISFVANSTVSWRQRHKFLPC